MTRHRPENFKFTGDNIDESNTQFAPGTPTTTIASIIESALALLRGVLGGTPNRAVRVATVGVDFTSYKIDIAVPGVKMKIGVKSSTNTITQAYPLKLLHGATIALDKFDEDHMKDLMKAFGR